MDKVIIYSLEHRQFWKACSMGYTFEQHEAGVYPRAQAEEIVQNANSHGSFNEVIITPFVIMGEAVVKATCDE